MIHALWIPAAVFLALAMPFYAAWRAVRSVSYAMSRPPVRELGGGR